MMANSFSHTGGEYGFGIAREVHRHLPLNVDRLGRKISDKPLLCQLEVAGVMNALVLGEIRQIGAVGSMITRTA